MAPDFAGFWDIAAEVSSAPPAWSRDLLDEWRSRVDPLADAPSWSDSGLAELDKLALAVATRPAASRAATVVEDPDPWVSAARLTSSLLRAADDPDEADCLVSWLLAVWALASEGIGFALTNEIPPPMSTAPNLGYLKWLRNLRSLDETDERAGWDDICQDPRSIWSRDSDLAARWPDHRKLIVMAFALYKKALMRHQMQRGA